MTIRSVYQHVLRSVGIGAVDTYSIHQLLQFHNRFPSVDFLLTNLDVEMLNYPKFLKHLSRLKNGEPIAYILGFTSFLNLKLSVNQHVLIPRQETEELVLHVMNIFSDVSEINVIDVGTGSGAIALALKSQKPDWHIIGTDISKHAIKIAKDNANNLHLPVTMLCGDGLNFLDDTYNRQIQLIISNPPYVEDVAQLDSSVKEFEPLPALIAKPNTKFYQQYLTEGKRLIAPKGIFAFEIDPSLAPTLSKLTQSLYPDATWTFMKDINGKTRFALLYT